MYSVFIHFDLVVAITSSIFPIASFFLFRIYFNYKKHSKHTSIKASSGSPMVTVSNESGTFEFTKDEIKIFIQYLNAGYRSPYLEYSFSKIVLLDNRTFVISNMIIEPYELEFKLSKVPTKRIHKYYPYIKNYIS